MKFTKEQLLDTLKSALTKNGKHLAISEKTLKSLTDNLYAIGVNEETELEEFAKTVLPTVESLRGNYEHDNAQFVKTFTEDWNSKHPTPKNEPTPSSDNNSEILKELNILREELSKEKAARTAERNKAEFISKLEEKGVKDSKWVAAYISNCPITDTTDIEKQSAAALEFYNINHSSKSTNYTPSPTGQGEPSKPDFSSVINIIKRNRMEE